MNEFFNPFETIFRKLESIETLLKHRPDIEVTATYLTINAAADFLGKTPNALRVMVYKDQIPHIKKQSKLFFRKADLIDWLESGRVEKEQLNPESILTKRLS